MFRWMPYAMVRVTIFFSTGVLIASWSPYVLSKHTTVLAGAGLFVLYLLLLFFLKRRFSGFIGLTTLVLLGYGHTQWHIALNNPDHVIHERTERTAYIAWVTRYAEEKENSWKVEAEIISTRDSTTWRSNSGKLLLYLAKNDFPVPYGYGDVLIVRGNPSLVRGPTNPGEFDIKRLLYFKNTYHQHYITAGNIEKIADGRGSVFIGAAIKVRHWADRQLKTFVAGDREQATASALVLGVTDGLDNELLQAYSATGAMHVLAVSGLHVSIIYWIILLIGKPLEKLRSGKATLAVISVVLLWIYAFVTGWSPSVLRAVMMFTFVALARPWKQSTNIYNTMAASAFCLLLYDPFFMMSVGFQLSYIAVFGIVFLHPWLYKVWEPERRVWDEVWKVTSVSLAAQAITFPISLLYFHQFPNYFLVANLLVIPASFVVLVVGLAILPLSVVPILAKATGFILEWTIWLMNSIVMVIGQLPYSLIQNIYIDSIQATLLTAFVICLSLCIINKQFKWMWYSVVFVVLFSIIDWIHVFSVVEKNHLIIYNIRGHTAIDLISHGNLMTYSDSALRQDSRKVSFHMAANRVSLGVGNNRQEIKRKISRGCEYLSWNGRTILIVTAPDFLPPQTLMADLVVVSNNSISANRGGLEKFAQLLAKVRSRKIVFDSSNSTYLVDKLMQSAKSNDVDLYSVQNSGAFHIQF